MITSVRLERSSTVPVLWTLRRLAAAKSFTEMLIRCSSGSASTTLSNRENHGETFTHRHDARQIVDKCGFVLSLVIAPRSKFVPVLALLLLVAMALCFSGAQPSGQTVETQPGHSTLRLAPSPYSPEAFQPHTRHLTDTHIRSLACWLRRGCGDPVEAPMRAAAGREVGVTRSLDRGVDARWPCGWRRKVGPALKKVLSVGMFVSLAAVANADLFLLSAIPAITSRY